MDDIRTYQAKRLARSGGETCLLELMPLPAKTTASWDYDELSNLGYLKSRKEYMAQIAPVRELALTQLIKTHRPKVVVFYSSSKDYIVRWKNIVGNGSSWSELPFGQTTRSEDTAFYYVAHPTSRVKNISDHYEALGEHMREALG